MQVFILLEQDLYFSRFVSLLKDSQLLDLKINIKTIEEIEEVKEKDIDLLICDELIFNVSNKFKDKLLSIKCLFLSKDKFVEKSEIVFEDSIYKYQDFRKIQQKILFCLSKINKINLIENENITRFISIYSPVNRCGKSEIIKNIAKEKSKIYKILVVSFDLYETIDINEEEFSEFLYFYLKEELSIEFLKSKIEEIDSVYYIFGINSYKDIYCLSEEEYMEFFKKIINLKYFDFILLDLDKVIFDLKNLLEISDKLIVPYLDDEKSNKKIHRFIEKVERINLKNKEKIEYLKMKKCENFETEIKKSVKNISTLMKEYK